MKVKSTITIFIFLKIISTIKKWQLNFIKFHGRLLLNFSNTFSYMLTILSDYILSGCFNCGVDAIKNVAQGSRLVVSELNLFIICNKTLQNIIIITNKETLLFTIKYIFSLSSPFEYSPLSYFLCSPFPFSTYLLPRALKPLFHFQCV